MVEAASDEFVVVADETKLVDGLGGSKLAMPVEVVKFCWKYNLVRLQEMFKDEGVEAKLRVDENGKPYVTDNFNYIVDLYFENPIKDGYAAGKEISGLEGVVEHGLFLDMATAVIIAGKTGVETEEYERRTYDALMKRFWETNLKRQSGYIYIPQLIIFRYRKKMEGVSHMTQRKTGQDEVIIDVLLESPAWNVIHIECNMFCSGDRY
ncbi:hypothetical protein OIU77_018685 [Salix suchowensis]|uniref:Uncharacterized protein n=1 Tax=Salix suchowensis TaxID=1278906 RepID=A0ABQ9CGF8_9ROSI|nr:hypothetical protein OIU77_018685 [Salix suchowensis]